MKTLTVKTGGWPFDQFIMDGDTVIAKCRMRSWSSNHETLNDVLNCDPKNKEVIQNAKLLASSIDLLHEIEDFLWRAEQRKNRGGKFLQRELNDIDNFKKVIEKLK